MFNGILLGFGSSGSTGNLSNVLTENYVFVGNSSNVATGVAMSGDATIVSSGALTIANSAITNAKVSAAAAIAFSKLAALSSGNILIGNSSNVATSITMSGDASISNTGVLTLANSGVTAATYTNATVTVDVKGRVTSASSGASVNTIYTADDSLTGARTVTLSASNSLTFSGGQTTHKGSGGTTGTNAFIVQNSTVEVFKVSDGRAVAINGATISTSIPLAVKSGHPTNTTGVIRYNVDGGGLNQILFANDSAKAIGFYNEAETILHGALDISTAFFRITTSSQQELRHSTKSGGINFDWNATNPRIIMFNVDQSVGTNNFLRIDKNAESFIGTGNKFGFGVNTFAEALTSDYQFRTLGTGNTSGLKIENLAGAATIADFRNDVNLLLFGASGIGTSGVGVIAHKLGTAPTTNITDTNQEFVGDIVAGNAAKQFKTENGTVLKIYQESAVSTSQGMATALGNQGFLATSTIAAEKLGIRNITLTDTIALTDYTITADATAGAITVNLPTAASASGYIFNIKKIDISVNAVTIDGNGAETIDGSTTQTLLIQYESITIQSSGTTWHIL